MNALSRIDTQSLNRALVGFDRLFDSFESRFANQLSSNYPPYNVVKIDENQYQVEIAVAGFKKEEISVEVDGELLIIKGSTSQSEDASPKQYLHRGLSSRDFVRQFSLAEHIKVQTASIQNGILSVVLERIIPEEMKPKLIDIVEIK